ncbi:MAG: type II secretion system protein N [Pseudomonadota bacterium]
MQAIIGGFRSAGSKVSWLKWSSRLANYGAMALVAFFAAGLLWRLVTIFLPAQSEEAVPALTAQAPVPGKGGAGAVPVVWNDLALFGRENVKTPVERSDKGAAARGVQSKARNLPPLKVAVHGILASTVSRQSYAILSVSGAKADLYRLGDEVAKEATLAVIQPRSVVIERGGVRQEFSLFDGEEGNRRPSAKASQRAPSSDSPGVRATEKRITDAETKRKIMEYREAMNTNPLSLVDKIRTYRVQRDGEPYGLRLRTGTDRGLLSSVGLRSGDILTKVNGVAVGSNENMPELMVQLRDHNEVLLDIERAGRPRQVRVILDDPGSMQ